MAQAALAASERVFDLVDEEPDVVDAPDAEDLPPLEGSLVFDNATFGYESAEPVLHDIRLEIDGGVSPTTIEEISKAGVNIFVAGSAVFGAESYQGAISAMKDKW